MFTFFHNSMRNRFLLCFWAYFFVVPSNAQSVYAPLDPDYYYGLQRLEIQQGRFSSLIHSHALPWERKKIVSFLESLPAPHDSIEAFIRKMYLLDSREWLSQPLSPSLKPWKKHFYLYPNDAYAVQNDAVDLHINPVINWQIGSITGGAQRYVSLNGRGIEIRGTLYPSIGFYSYMTENIARIPDYVKDYADAFNRNALRKQAMPGMPSEGHSKWFKKDPLSLDFMSARAYLTLNASKYLSLQFGHDKNFIGQGFRSMILSDNAAPYLFLKINTHINKVQYQQIFAQLVNPDTLAIDQVFPKKYLALHHLSLHLTPRWQLGFTESIVFKRDSLEKGFDFNYLNPVILYRFVESFQGSGDNALLALDFAHLINKRAMLYGQLILDEFIIKELLSNSTFWANKYGLQLGFKYLNLANVAHLDWQTEGNLARPYLYSHQASGQHYSHYNQALAHPLGANFVEWVHILRYQPSPRLQLATHYITALYGTDKQTSDNWGQNILLDYTTRTRLKRFQDNYGNTLLQGLLTHLHLINFRASYQVKHKTFLDFTFLYRINKNAMATQQNTIFMLGFRWNAAFAKMYF